MATTVPPNHGPRLPRSLVLLAGAASISALAWYSWYLASRTRQDVAAPAVAGAPAPPAGPAWPEVPVNRLVTAPAPVPAPDIDLPTADGKRFSLASSRGQVVVVNLWATWCAPCVKELPGLVRLAQDLARRHPAKVQLVAVAVDEQPDAVRRFFEGAPFGDLPRDVVVALEPGAGEVARGYPCRGRGACRPEDTRLPETYVVDQQGRIVALVVGELDWSLPGPRQYLEALLAR
jgi:thiol-disulfide isomerase/thioredoxin